MSKKLLPLLGLALLAACAAARPTRLGSDAVAPGPAESWPARIRSANPASA